ncbi:MAG: hypothetical protein V2B18_04665 [Pseudomonadota bacterium]
MPEKPSPSEILMRKFEPVTDWKPVEPPGSELEGLIATIAREALGQVQSAAANIEKHLEPVAGAIEATVSEWSGDARASLSRTLGMLADRIKPKD